MELTLRRSTGDRMVYLGFTLPYDDDPTEAVDFTIKDPELQQMLQTSNDNADSEDPAYRTTAYLFAPGTF